MPKKPNYNQTAVNGNMEELFDLAPTIQDKMKNIIRTEKAIDKEINPMKNNQINQEVTPAPVKKKGRGGARANSGRKVGSTQKLSATTLLDAIAAIDMPFEQGIAEDYYKARMSGDLHVIQKYQNMILSKVIADKQELDVTSNGQTLVMGFNFPTTELPEWQDDQTKH